MNGLTFPQILTLALALVTSAGLIQKLFGRDPRPQHQRHITLFNGARIRFRAPKHQTEPLQGSVPPPGQDTPYASLAEYIRLFPTWSTGPALQSGEALPGSALDAITHGTDPVQQTEPIVLNRRAQTEITTVLKAKEQAASQEEFYDDEHD